MKRKRDSERMDEMLPEYDFSGDARGKYAQQYKAGSNIVAIDPELSAAFPTQEAVDIALRRILAIESGHS